MGGRDIRSRELLLLLDSFIVFLSCSTTLVAAALGRRRISLVGYSDRELLVGSDILLFRHVLLGGSVGIGAGFIPLVESHVKHSNCVPVADKFFLRKWSLRMLDGPLDLENGLDVKDCVRLGPGML